ncbi:MAG TPA: DUF429 domain-containing protein [Stellaceae bacterium]|nr:DUF429 domain-containing protein [Stellaceae bacterium]
MIAQGDKTPSECEVLIGFDSAWTDNKQKPGAITAYVSRDPESPIFYPPTLATFDVALKLVNEWTSEAAYTLLAIDQPTIVPNDSGCRPVDRVAGSLVSSLGGGVQPARRGGTGALMFGEGAPIWRFLGAVGAIENPFVARDAGIGRFVIEVFPALALSAIVPEIWRRHRAAKYNPAASNFALADWQMVASAVGKFARGLGATDLAAWVETQVVLPKPVKADQDRLDAAICLLIALAWRRGPREQMLVIGDERTGYMATITLPQTRALLVKAATERDIAVDRPWMMKNGSALARLLLPPLPVAHADYRHPGRPDTVIKRSRERATGPALVDLEILRTLLIARARKAAPIAYGEVAEVFAQRWTRGFGSSLTRALNQLAIQNRTTGEPLLMCLVINKETRLPGKGYYDEIGRGNADLAMQRKLFAEEIERCRKWHWN